MPAVLTENFMMYNVEDAAFLLSEKGKTAIIKTHIDGINRYLIAYNELFKVLF
jgi:N-acetylmuramoyl-L-alanine amidase